MVSRWSQTKYRLNQGPANCEYCQSSYTKNVKNQKYCSYECAKKHQEDITGRIVQGNKLPTGTVGAITEIQVASELMRKGYAVFRALSPACFCDVIAIKGAVVLNVEARTGYLNKVNKKLQFPKRLNGPANCYAVLERNSGDIYFLDLEGNPLNV